MGGNLLSTPPKDQPAHTRLLQWKGGALVEIWKGKGAHDMCAAHRGILVSDSIGKIAKSKLRQRLIQQARPHDHELQCEKNLGADIASHIVRSFQAVCGHAKHSHAIIFLDVHAAFYSAIRQFLAKDDASISDAQICYVLSKVNIPPDAIPQLQRHLQQATLLDGFRADEHLQAMVNESLSNVYFSTEGLRSIVETNAGTRPGDAIADLLFSFIMGWILKLSLIHISEPTRPY